MSGRPSYALSRPPTSTKQEVDDSGSAKEEGYYSDTVADLVEQEVKKYGDPDRNCY